MSTFVDHFELENRNRKAENLPFIFKKRRAITINLISRDILNNFTKIPGVLIIKFKRDVTSYDEIALLY